VREGQDNGQMEEPESEGVRRAVRIAVGQDASVRDHMSHA